MNRSTCLVPTFQIVLGSVVAAWLASVGFAQVIHPDQMFGTFSPQMESRPGDNPASSDQAGTEPDQGFDRQLVVPDLDATEGTDMNMLRTPDSKDAEEARESDRQSAVSY